MKMYFFDYDGYGEEFTVMAKTKKEAFDYLLLWMDKDNYYEKDDWVNATIDNLPKDYKIVEFSEGQVLETETA